MLTIPAIESVVEVPKSDLFVPRLNALGEALIIQAHAGPIHKYDESHPLYFKNYGRELVDQDFDCQLAAPNTIKQGYVAVHVRSNGMATTASTKNGVARGYTWDPEKGLRNKHDLDPKEAAETIVSLLAHFRDRISELS